MENRNIQYRNKNIYYRLAGKGMPVVILHGFGEDGNIWNGLISGLQENYQLIVPDIPGSGKSEILEEGNGSIKEYAEVLKAILEEEKITQCCVIGHSMGGYIALAFAEKYPGYLKGLGLFHSSAFADDAEKKATRLKAISFINENGSYAFLKTVIPKLFAGKQHLAEMEELIEKGKQFTPGALIQYYHAMINRSDTTHVLKSFTKPVLFIIGEKDNAIPLPASLKQCHFPAKAHVHILDTGHMGMIEKSTESLQIVQSFLENV